MLRPRPGSLSRGRPPLSRFAKLALLIALGTTACAEVTSAPAGDPSVSELFAGDEHPAFHGHAGLLPAGVDREIVVAIRDFAFEPSAIEVQPGETVMFTLVNQGAFEHEFRLTTAHGAEEHIAGGHEGHHEEGAEGDTDAHGDMFTMVAAGAAKAMIVTFDEHAQFDIFACLIPGHYEEGMSGALAGLAGGDDHHGTEDHHGIDDHHGDAVAADDHHGDAAAGDDHHGDVAAGDDHHGDAAAGDDHHGDATAGDDHTGAGIADHRMIEISVHDDEFHPHAVEVVRGETVMFTVTNEGQEDHEFRLTTAHAAEEHVASGGHGQSGGHGHGDMVMTVAAGATESMMVTFDADSEFDTFACFLPGHFERGLSGELSISG